jgi:uncharacterized protein YdeI (YjbR/CyaY-like superfamily)
MALQRQRYPMPEFVEQALNRRHLMALYQQRPAYQQNDYVGWITRAKRPETKLKRLNQMLYELEAGDIYMNTPWQGRPHHDLNL